MNNMPASKPALTKQQLDDIEAVINAADQIGADIVPDTARALVAEIRRQGSILAAVLALHEKGEHNGLPICLHCASQMFPPPETGIWSESAYPCATLQALGATEPSPVTA